MARITALLRLLGAFGGNPLPADLGFTLRGVMISGRSEAEFSSAGSESLSEAIFVLSLVTVSLPGSISAAKSVDNLYQNE
jgi:hypothetical protein